MKPKKLRENVKRRRLKRKGSESRQKKLKGNVKRKKPKRKDSD